MEELPLKITERPKGTDVKVIELDKFNNKTLINSDGTKTKLFREN